MDSVQFREWRKARGWTQARTAEEMGVSRDTVIRWENEGLCRNGRLVELACERLAQERIS